MHHTVRPSLDDGIQPLYRTGNLTCTPVQDVHAYGNAEEYMMQIK